MPNINPVDLTTLGARVTDAAQLTEGRWYAVRVNCSGPHKPLVHAKYAGMVGWSLHAFDVCVEDYRAVNPSLGLSKRIQLERNSIRSGRLPSGSVCEIFKFKQVVDSPVSTSHKSPHSTGNCKRNGIKVGDKFVVVSDSATVAKGTVVTLANDDGTNCPYFEVPWSTARQAIYLWCLAPVSPAVTLSPIDQIKSEIDALNAQKQIKQEEIDKLTKDVATIGGEVDKLKQKVADSLKEYLPEPKKPIW